MWRYCCRSFKSSARHWEATQFIGLLQEIPLGFSVSYSVRSDLVQQEERWLIQAWQFAALLGYLAQQWTRNTRIFFLGRRVCSFWYPSLILLRSPTVVGLSVTVRNMPLLERLALMIHSDVQVNLEHASFIKYERRRIELCSWYTVYI